MGHGCYVGLNGDLTRRWGWLRPVIGNADGPLTQEEACWSVRIAEELTDLAAWRRTDATGLEWGPERIYDRLGEAFMSIMEDARVYADAVRRYRPRRACRNAGIYARPLQ